MGMDVSVCCLKNFLVLVRFTFGVIWKDCLVLVLIFLGEEEPCLTIVNIGLILKEYFGSEESTFYIDNFDNLVVFW